MAEHITATRIIPARAGFTSTPATTSRSWRDHPRSRGVYLTTQGAGYLYRGSSPLARGLHLEDDEFWDAVGIIPARAGFTRPQRRAPSPGPDHPRSRGVYPWTLTGSGSTRGSSPLARGLLAGPLSHELLIRIIPARAGFTSNDIWDLNNTLGSSPLARGLPTSARASPVRIGITPARAGFTYEFCAASAPGRIIPARAGFTSPRGRPACRVRDHPRSRGVYSTSQAPTTSCRGSSPLARGLRGFSRTGEHSPRIIPARAGFTSRTGGRGRVGWDHPRSRGVYGTVSSDAERRQGSSPLARGLLQVRRTHEPRARIIPARAGFTPALGPPHVRDPDHPRSRGVYPARPGDGCPPPGSSPLARGLQDLWSGARWLAGIIPARAGFTSGRRNHEHEPADHPRSRGVYDAGAGARAGSTGSSPLARGLRPRDRRAQALVGIIPARAGFTPARLRQPAAPEDHPRSRGVYISRVLPDGEEMGSFPLARGLRN